MKRLLVFLVLSMVGCQMPTALREGLNGAVQFAPAPRFEEIWHSLEKCSGLHRNYAAVKWYRTDSLIVQGQRDNGAYFGGANIIILTNQMLDPNDRVYIGNHHELVVAHEEMHALLQRGDHPAEYFNGVCGYLLGPGSPVGPARI